MSGQRLRLKGYSEGERLRDLALGKLLSVMTFLLSKRRVVCTGQLPFPVFAWGAPILSSYAPLVARIELFQREAGKYCG